MNYYFRILRLFNYHKSTWDLLFFTYPLISYTEKLRRFGTISQVLSLLQKEYSCFRTPRILCEPCQKLTLLFKIIPRGIGPLTMVHFKIYATLIMEFFQDLLCLPTFSSSNLLKSSKRERRMDLRKSDKILNSLTVL